MQNKTKVKNIYVQIKSIAAQGSVSIPYAHIHGKATHGVLKYDSNFWTDLSNCRNGLRPIRFLIYSIFAIEISHQTKFIYNN